jgi:hypothetical protein
VVELSPIAGATAVRLSEAVMGLVGVSEEHAAITAVLATASATGVKNRRLDMYGS